MTSLSVWLLIFGGMVITYTIRMLFILLIPSDKLPQQVRTALEYVPPAVLAALIVPELLLMEGQLQLNLQNHRLIAGVLSAVVGWRTKNTWLTIGTGMLLLWLLEYWF